MAGTAMLDVQTPSSTPKNLLEFSFTDDAVYTARKKRATALVQKGLAQDHLDEEELGFVALAIYETTFREMRGYLDIMAHNGPFSTKEVDKVITDAVLSFGFQGKRDRLVYWRQRLTEQKESIRQSEPIGPQISHINDRLRPIHRLAHPAMWFSRLLLQEEGQLDGQGMLVIPTYIPRAEVKDKDGLHRTFMSYFLRETPGMDRLREESEQRFKERGQPFSIHPLYMTSNLEQAIKD